MENDQSLDTDDEITSELQDYLNCSKDRVVGWEGEVIGAGLVDARHNISRQQLHYYREHKLAVAFRRGTRNFVYPEEQFYEQAILVGIREVIQLAGGVTEAWIFLTTRHPQLKGARPIDLLKESKSDSVIQHLEAYKEGEWV